MTNLTAREDEVLAYILGYISDNNYSPMLREIAMKFGFTKMRASQLVDSLVRKGRIRKTSGYRGIRIK
ncbi:MAG: hypothetical protein AAB706_01440 [Patescibacteria group bacterium]